MSRPTGPDLRDAMRRPVSGPPAGLAQKIKSAIPDDLGSEAADSGDTQRPMRARRWATAASIVMALGAGLAGWRLFESELARDPQAPQASQTPEQSAPSPQQLEAKEAVEPPTRLLESRLAAVSETPAPAAPAPTALRRRIDTGTTDKAEFFGATDRTRGLINAAADPLSTFSLDVDTGAYTLARRYLEREALPPPGVVRVEEFLNYFDYDDPRPLRSDLAIHLEGGPTPFLTGDDHRLVRIGISARQVEAGDRRPANLVFLIDVSGSMARQGRLQQVRSALTDLAGELSESDRIGIVAYSDRASLLLESTGDRRAVTDAIDRLVPGGSTHLEEGLSLAYALAARHWMTDGINRIILCSDGVANVGATSASTILAGVDDAVQEGIEITTIGFGLGDYNDQLMEQLADRGNGNYFYVDTPSEARRVMIENLTGTLETVAADARVQVVFEPAQVAEYRLLGYENRQVADARFRDTTVNAGEIGAGHRVTVLYDIRLRKPEPDGPIAGVHLRWRGTDQIERERRGTLRAADLFPTWEAASPSLRRATIAAELAETLRGAAPPTTDRLAALAREAESLAAGGRAQEQELARLIAITQRLLSAR